ncbi:GNAT family N-acetyltransferase [Lacihabitans lacunae]|uniref:GNAT family N-acetyltransferase n=1 Tax=Lacihabitans lacunae TaxID=1028214 RepID=A0ABV7Z3Z0_9BACT
MIKFVKTNAENPDFLALVKRLDATLKITDGVDHIFYSQFNKVDNIKHILVAYDNKVPVGCGAIKAYSDTCMEVKRMFVDETKRGEGLGLEILTRLEKWAAQLGCDSCILETGKRQVDAIALYKKAGYAVIENYGQYSGVENSVCFEKKIK